MKQTFRYRSPLHFLFTEVWLLQTVKGGVLEYITHPALRWMSNIFLITKSFTGPTRRIFSHMLSHKYSFPLFFYYIFAWESLQKFQHSPFEFRLSLAKQKNSLNPDFITKQSFHFYQLFIQ